MCAVKLATRRSAPLVVTVFAAALPIDRAAAAPIVINQRNTVQDISFADTSAFSDAQLSHTSTFQITGNVGDSLALGWSVPDGATGFNVTTSSGFSASAPVLTPGSPNNTESFTVTALATTSGSFAVGDRLGVNVAPPGADTTLSTGVSAGEHYLDATFNPLANQTSGATFTYQAVLPGNYSTVGTASGDHELVSLNSAWTVTQNFAFNGTDTVFAATINDYNPSTDRINLEYQVYGTPAVPLPAAAWLLLSGLGGLGLLGRRRAAA